MNYDEVAKKVFQDMLNYKVNDESVNQVITKLINMNGNFTEDEVNKITVKVIHVMSVSGYDIDCIKPFKMKKYID